MSLAKPLDPWEEMVDHLSKDSQKAFGWLTEPHSSVMLGWDFHAFYPPDFFRVVQTAYWPQSARKIKETLTHITGNPPVICITFGYEITI